MNINNRIATLDAIFQELKDSYPSSIYISKRKYKLNDDEVAHIEAMLKESGLVDVTSKDYHRDFYTLKSYAYNELKKHGSYSVFLKERIIPIPHSVKTTPNNKDKKHTIYTSWIFIYLIWPIVTGLIIIVIAKYFRWN